MTEGPRDRRVAIVTYFFPPLGGVGVQRVLKYATFLPRWGWRASIFTARKPAYEVLDPELDGSVPRELEVHRSFIVEPAHLIRPLVRRLHRTRVSSSAGPAGQGSGASMPARVSSAVKAVVRRLASASRRAAHRVVLLVFVPDDQVMWLPFGIRSLRSAQRIAEFDAVLSSSPPITAHLIAGFARQRGTPWVADFRDPWIGGAFEPRLPRLHRAVRRRIEHWIVTRADAATFATPSLRAQYAARYPELADRFVTLTNGYDRNDLPTPERPRHASGEFRIVYAGSLYGERELGVFIEGLRRAMTRRPELQRTLRVEFIGWLSGHNRALADEASRDPALAAVLSFTGFRPQHEALRHIAAADAGLLILTDEPGKGVIVPVKMFDYLGLNRQILAAVPRGDVRDILHDLDWGIIVQPDAAGIAAGIERLITSPARRRQSDPGGRFDRATIAAGLASLLDAVADRSSPDRDGLATVEQR
jgi:glycosyltransferase involved in cell wall biosynthesis